VLPTGYWSCCVTEDRCYTRGSRHLHYLLLPPLLLLLLLKVLGHQPAAVQLQVSQMLHSGLTCRSAAAAAPAAAAAGAGAPASRSSIAAASVLIADAAGDRCCCCCCSRCWGTGQPLFKGSGIFADWGLLPFEQAQCFTGA
jgi:hypothetical protein